MNNRRTLTFPNQSQYKAFVKAWGRYSLRGYVGGKGTKDIAVTIDVTEQDNEWINEYLDTQKKFEELFEEFDELFS